MKRKPKILFGSAIVFVAFLVALFLARRQFVGGPGSPTVEGSRAVTDGGIKIMAGMEESMLLKRARA